MLSLFRRAWPAGFLLLTVGCAPDDEMDRWVSERIEEMTLEDKVAQLFVTYIHGQSPDTAEPKNQRDFGVDTATQVITRYRPGGVIYFNNNDNDNIENPKQIAGLSNGLQRAALAAGAKVPLFISTDQETGLVTRIGPPAAQFPGNMAVCAGRSTSDARKVAAINGRELRAMGINVNFAPDADVNSNPVNPVIGVRSFSSNPDLAAQFVVAQVEGYQESGEVTTTVSATAKHFPGHGDTKDDSHYGLPRIDRTLEDWRRIEAPPFIAASHAGIDAIMTAHIEVPKIDPSGEPSTLSHRIVTGLLREELGYKGLIITDSLRMEGVRKTHPDSEIPVLALKAGVDQLLMPVNLDNAIKSVVSAVQNGTLTQERIEASVKRVLEAKYKRGVVAKPMVDEGVVDQVVGAPAHVAEAVRITDRTVTVLRNDGNVLPLRTKPTNVLVTGVGVTATRTLAEAFKTRGSNATPQAVALAPSENEIAAAVGAANQSDFVIMLTNAMTTPANASQKRLLAQLVATGKPLVAVATRNPYDAALVEEATVWLATYSSGAGSMESLAKVLLGEVSPSGKLPVDIPAASDPTKVRYPLGHGLTW